MAELLANNVDVESFLGLSTSFPAFNGLVRVEIRPIVLFSASQVTKNLFQTQSAQLEALRVS